MVAMLPQSVVVPERVREVQNNIELQNMVITIFVFLLSNQNQFDC